MAKQMLGGMRLAIAVEPEGTLVKTNSPFVDGRKVTLLDLSFDQLMGNEAAFARLQTARTPEDLRAVMKEVPGLKMTLDPQVTIEFTPGR
jgi:hypothetical protein